MNLPTLIEDLIFAVERGRAEWDGVVESFSDEQCLPPYFMNNWTLKDLMAHVSWYENQMEQMVSNHSMDTEGGELWSLSTDDRNAKIYDLYKDKSLADIKIMAKQRYDKMLAALKKLDDADVTDSKRYEGMPSDWIPADIIAQNTWLHYAEHLLLIKRKFGK